MFSHRGSSLFFGLLGSFALMACGEPFGSSANSGSPDASTDNSNSPTKSADNVSSSNSSLDGGGTATGHLDVCSLPNTTYTVHYQKLSGNCAPFNDALDSTSADGTFPILGDCTNLPTYSECGMLYDNYTCNYVGTPPNPDSTTVISGKINWSVDGSSGEGDLTITPSVADSPNCSGSYHITYTKQ